MRFENEPALMFVLPDASEGANGSGFAQGVPLGPLVMLKLDEGCSISAALAGSATDQGVNEDCVVYVPHSAGVARGARSVPKNSSFRAENGAPGCFRRS